MRNKIVTALFASSLLASALLAVPAQVLAVPGPVTHWVALGATLSDGPGTSCADPGYRSNNQDALEDALNHVSEEDIVHICAGEYVYTASFSHLASLPDNVTIEGAGAGSTILNGADQYDLLGIFFAVGIVVQDMSFEHGEGIYGAGLYIESSEEVDVLNCTFSNNEGSYGGALVAYDSTVVIENSTFTENIATHDAEDYGGGAVYNYSGEISIVNSRFVRNESAGVGGAVELWDDSPVTISGSTFIGNKAQQGPAIDVYGDDSPLIVTGSSFINNVNTARERGAYGYDDAAAISSENNDSDLTLTGNIFHGNRGAEYGGAVEVWDVTGEIIIANNRFERNVSDEGGALWIDVRGGTQDIRGNTFRGNRAKKGGAIAFECEVSPVRTVSRLLARQNRFSGNSASRSARSANVFASDYGNCTD